MATLTILSAATSAATPPVAWGLVPVSWRRPLVQEFDLELWALAATNLTAAKLLGGTRQAQVLADDDVDGVDTTDNELDITSHAFQTGDGPVRITTSGAVPGGLAVATDYWVIKRSANAISLATSFEHAMTDVEIDLSAGASGTNTVVDTASTQRVHWHSHGFLGEAGDGAVTLTAQMSYRVRCKHANPRIELYALVATFSAAEAVTCTLHPVGR